MRVAFCFFEPECRAISLMNEAAIELISFRDIRRVMGDDPECRIAFVAPSPVTLLSLRLHRGGAPSECFEQTCEAAGEILRAYRTARRRVVLFDAHEIEEWPDVFRRAVSELAADASKKIEPLPASSGEPAGVDATDALAEVIASAMIRADRKAAMLQAEFEASRTTLREPGLD